MTNQEIFNTIIEKTNFISGTSTRGGVPMHDYVTIRADKDGGRYTWTLLRYEGTVSDEACRRHYMTLSYLTAGSHFSRDMTRFYSTDESFESAIKGIIRKYNNIEIR